MVKKIELSGTFELIVFELTVPNLYYHYNLTVK